ncbi:MAG: alpha-2-macroglobulin [Crocinitomicaceae bacterium]|nr:alpha-2-macroglobulin [Crocinitomicaceae bacterium]
MKIKILALALIISVLGIGSATIVFKMQNAKFKRQNIESDTEMIIQNTTQGKPAIFPKGERPERFDRYEKEWAIVDSLEQKGLVKSCYDEVLKIKEKALKDKNYPQIIKATVFTIKFNSYLREDDYPTAVNDLRLLVETFPEPAKSVAHSILAEVYWGYYQRNRWRIYNRTQVVDMKIEDIETWDLKTIAEQTRNHYMLSVSNLEVLKENNIADYSAILTTLNKENVLRRPTLLDLVGHRAIDFFQNTEFDVPTRTAETFNFNKPYFLEDAKRFADTYIVTNDSLSTKFFALKVYQFLTKQHMDDKDPIALIDLTLKRLDWAKNSSTVENKEDLYMNTLRAMSKTYADHKIMYPEIMYKIAQKISADGNLYDEKKGDEHKKDKARAHEICTEIIEKYDGTIGAQFCKQLQNEIENKSMSHQNESAALPNTPGMVRFSYKNVPKVYYRIYAYDQEKWESDDFEKAAKILNGQKPEHTQIIELKDIKDYNWHTTEYEIPGLPKGHYIITFSSSETLDEEKEAWSYSTYRSTGLMSKQRTNQETEEIEVFVNDRMNGAPIVGANVEVFSREYNYKLRKYTKKTLGNYTTNENGMITARGKRYQNYQYEVKYKDDFIPSSGYLYQPYNSKPYLRNQIQIFTDRAIYRPGQEVYFKGIVWNGDRKDPKIVPGFKTTVTLKDYNYQKIADVDVTSNEYGTFEGTFTAPQGVVTGNMTLYTSYGSKNIRVEEYKRPKFEVDYKKVKGEFRVGDEIEVIGFAKAFAGNMLDGAKVNYRVTRNAYFPSWCYWRWGYSPRSTSFEIKNGDIETDDKGEFKIRFTAKPDESVEQKFQPKYSYTIYATVTDINGETHSASKVVYAGYTGFELSSNLPSQVNLGNKKLEYYVNALNLNGEKVETDVNVKIEKLKVPNEPMKAYLFDKPGQRGWTKENFKTKFSGYEYDDENQVHKWEVEKEVYAKTLSTKGEDKNIMDLKKVKGLVTGTYKYSAKSTDKYGNTIEDIQYFTVISFESKTIPNNVVLYVQTSKTWIEPGEELQIMVGTKGKNLKVLYELEVKGKLVERKWIDLNENAKVIRIPIKEEYRGNIAFSFNTNYNNREFNYNTTISVPYTNKDLDLKFSTFRDKLYPGTEEEWTLEIKDNENKGVLAEVLATMYDASLDEFASNSFYLNVRDSYYQKLRWQVGFGTMAQSGSLRQHSWNPYVYAYGVSYYNLNWFYFNPSYYDSYYTYKWRSTSTGNYSRNGGGGEKMKKMEAKEAYNAAPAVGGVVMMDEVAEEELSVSEDAAFAYGEGDFKDQDKSGKADAFTVALDGNGQLDSRMDNREGGKSVQIRKNFNETAFFYPNLYTEADGTVKIKFTMPDALTKWKFLALAHTQDLKIGTIQKEIVTQKDLMVFPNDPRFFREMDTIYFNTKISNLTDEVQSGNIKLELIDPFTGNEVSGDFKMENQTQSFETKAKLSTSVEWKLIIPEGIGAVKYKVVAQTAKFSDGEEKPIPVLTNRMLVTESMPMSLKAGKSKTFTFEKLFKSQPSSTLKSHRLTLEYTPNPAWYAIQAMPYIMEYPYECNEQTFSRFYSNSIASHIMNSNPKIKEIFDAWKNYSPEAFLSNLEKNQELKGVMLEETPWLLNAKDESARKRRIGVLFDLNRMSNELDRALRKLKQNQKYNGGWPWFKNGPESYYITKHIMCGFGHLDKLGVKSIKSNYEIKTMVNKGISFIDGEFIERYEWIKKHVDNYEKVQMIGYDEIHYLYTRSFFPDHSKSKKLQEAIDYFERQAKLFWLNFNPYSQGMMALAMHRNDQKAFAQDIMKSLKEKSIIHDELGMYWKNKGSGYYWYQAPIESQALLIEAFYEITEDLNSVDEMKTWLIKQKQTNEWPTTKATTEACYALFLTGDDLLSETVYPDIQIGNEPIRYNSKGKESPYNVKPEPGTGYFKTSWEGDAIKPEMGQVKVKSNSKTVSWGALYWQYFEQLDKITFHETPLSIKKDLFVVTNTDNGPVLKPITSKPIKVGDKIKVRIEIRVDRDMEYVHLKDMRASSFEPLNVLSQYKWQDGLGYYEATKDAATNFFFGQLPKGTYVFEYEMFATQKGKFSNGITTAQCMYAPEFTSHSEGIRVTVE